jgi:hypothetical protein
VAPGQSHLFTFTLKGLPEVGHASTNWQMVEEGVQWFGEPTGDTKIAITEKSGGCSASDNPGGGGGGLPGPTCEIDDDVTPNNSVHAFYYTWYRDDRNHSEGLNEKWRHWNQNGNNPPNVIASNFYPSLGPYDSSDPDVMARHFCYLHNAGVGVIVLSYWGAYDPADPASDDSRFVSTVLGKAHAAGLKVAWHLEPNVVSVGGKAQLAARSADEYVQMINHINNTYSGHPAFYKHGTKGVFYIFSSHRGLNPSGTAIVENCCFANYYEPLDALKQNNIILAQTTDARAIRNEANGVNDGNYFSGLYNYSKASASAWQTAATECRNASAVWSPSVVPGYLDDRAVEGQGAEDFDRDGAHLYKTQWMTAKAQPYTFISITSFNEWHEGTQIEPARSSPPTDVPYQTYGDDEEIFLTITRNYIDGLPGAATAAPSQAATLLSPAGVVQNPRPSFGWEDVPEASRYRVVVQDAGANVVIDEVEAATSLLAPEPLPVDADYTWTVTAENGLGTGPEATPQSFRVVEAPPDEPPTVRIVGPDTCVVPCNVELTAEASDPEGGPVAYQWWGCASGFEPAASCTAGEPGTQWAAVAVFDAQGWVTEMTKEIEVFANQPPAVEVLVGSSCDAAGCLVSFSAVAEDPEGDSLTYSWSGCGSGSEPVQVCGPATAGALAATVEVGDPYGVTTAGGSATVLPAGFDTSCGSCVGDGAWSCTSAAANGCRRSGTQSCTSVATSWTIDPAQAAPPPEETQACTETAHGHVAHYSTSSWSGCSKSCGSGTQTRSVWADQWRATPPNVSRPASSQACNTQPCALTCGDMGWYGAGERDQCNAECSNTCVKKQWCGSGPCEPWPHYCWKCP